MPIFCIFKAFIITFLLLGQFSKRLLPLRTKSILRCLLQNVIMAKKLKKNLDNNKFFIGGKIQNLKKDSIFYLILLCSHCATSWYFFFIHMIWVLTHFRKSFGHLYPLKTHYMAHTIMVFVLLIVFLVGQFVPSFLFFEQLFRSPSPINVKSIFWCSPIEFYYNIIFKK